jgi:hypothetical protein
MFRPLRSILKWDIQLFIIYVFILFYLNNCLQVFSFVPEWSKPISAFTCDKTIKSSFWAVLQFKYNYNEG